MSDDDLWFIFRKKDGVLIYVHYSLIFTNGVPADPETNKRLKLEGYTTEYPAKRSFVTKLLKFKKYTTVEAIFFMIAGQFLAVGNFVGGICILALCAVLSSVNTPHHIKK